MLLPGSDTCFLKVSPHVSLKLATKGYFRGKKTLEISRKFTYLGSSSKGKTEECDQRNWSFSDKSGITIPHWTTYFLEVGSRVSLKVATKGCLRSK